MLNFKSFQFKKKNWNLKSFKHTPFLVPFKYSLIFHERLHFHETPDFSQAINLPTLSFKNDLMQRYGSFLFTFNFNVTIERVVRQNSMELLVLQYGNIVEWEEDEVLKMVSSTLIRLVCESILQSCADCIYFSLASSIE